MSADGDRTLSLEQILNVTELESSNICHQYALDNLNGSALSTLVSVSVSVINIILRTINIFLISLIGYHTESN